MASVAGTVADFCKLAREHQVDAVQVWRGPVGGKGGDDLIATQPIATLDADRLTLAITTEADECAGRVRFTLKSVRAGVEVARDRVILEGGVVGGPITRSSHAQGSLVNPPPGLAPPRAVDGILEDLASSGVSDFGARTNAAVASALLREQMKQNVQLVNLLVDHTSKMQGPLLKQTETLSAALDLAHKKLIDGAEAHVAHVRQGRVLEVEAKNDERRAAAFERTGEMFAKYLPGVLARISRKYGIAGEDDENDPLLEKLVTSFKSSQIERMQKILDPEQLALFAEVWASMDERQGKREAKRKTKKGAAQSGRRVVDTRKTSTPDASAANGAAAALEALSGLRLASGER